MPFPPYLNSNAVSTSQSLKFGTTFTIGRLLNNKLMRKVQLVVFIIAKTLNVCLRFFQYSQKILLCFTNWERQERFRWKNSRLSFILKRYQRSKKLKTKLLLYFMTTKFLVQGPLPRKFGPENLLLKYNAFHTKHCLKWKL